MQRTIIELPDALDALLRGEAKRRGITVSQLTREAIESHIGRERRQLDAVAAGRSGRTDISVRIEELLSAESSTQRR